MSDSTWTEQKHKINQFIIEGEWKLDNLDKIRNFRQWVTDYYIKNKKMPSVLACYSFLNPDDELELDIH